MAFMGFHVPLDVRFQIRHRFPTGHEIRDFFARLLTLAEIGCDCSANQDCEMVAQGQGGVAGLDDPNLTQEEKDHRLAISLQQQENSAAYTEHKKKHDELLSAKQRRTGRSVRLGLGLQLRRSARRPQGE